MGFQEAVLLITFTLFTGFVVSQTEGTTFTQLDDDGDSLLLLLGPLPGPLLSRGSGDSQTAAEVMEKLKQLGITPEILFDVRSKSGIKRRSKLPHLGAWMNRKIECAFQYKNPMMIYELLGRCADLLQIANVGCLNERCSTPVLRIHRKYQDMIYKASKISYDGILTTIKLMRYFQYAIRKPKKYRVRILAYTAKFTRKFARSYRDLSIMAEELNYLFVTAFLETNIIRRDYIEEIRQINKDFYNITIQLAVQKLRKKEIMEYVKSMVGEIKNIEAGRNRFLLQEYMKLFNTPVKDITHCVQAVIPQYKIITTPIRNYRNYRYNTHYKKESLRISDKLDRKCWKKKDQVHLNKLTHDMDAILKQLNRTRPRYINLLAGLAQMKRERIDVFEIVAENIAKLEIFNATKTETRKVVDTLLLVMDSLRVVKSIMAETKEFWKRQEDFITEKLQKRSIPGISDDGDEEEFGDEEGLTPDNSFFEIGLKWMMFGKLSALAYEENERNKIKVNKGLPLTSKQTKEVMYSARSTITEIGELHKKIKEKSDIITRSKMESALLTLIRS